MKTWRCCAKWRQSLWRCAVDNITFPTREESRVTKLYKAIGRFERHNPMAAWVIALVLCGVVMTVSLVVPQ